MATCDHCKQSTEVLVPAVVAGKYVNISPQCLAVLGRSSSPSSGYQSFDRRRQYEDYAQDTVQPYDAMGKPRAEFYRLYPQAAEKTFTKDEIEQVRRQL